MKSGEYLCMGLFLVVSFFHGCSTAVMVGAGAGTGVGTYSYVEGELTARYPYSYDQTWNATLTALEKLEIEVTSRQRDALSGKITGKRGDGKRVAIKIEDESLGVTKVAVRVGTFGNQEASRKIQQTILNVLEGEGST